MARYDLMVVGAGLFGAVFAHEAMRAGKRVLVVEKREHVGGNCYTREMDGINVHEYGAHIFRTNDKAIWDYMRDFCDFNHFVNSPMANYHGELYNLPFNMNTFYELWGARTPDEAREAIERTRVPCSQPQNLEEYVLDLVGSDIYEKLIKGYTEKQWGHPCTDLPSSVMRRIPLRFTFDNNYFNDRYQGIPIGGYTAVIEKMLQGATVECGVDYLSNREGLESAADTVLYIGPIDAFYQYRFGALEYRSLKFEHRVVAVPNYQGVAVMNYTDAETAYTRTIEHKHFEFGRQTHTAVTWEYPSAWEPGLDPYYPMEDEGNVSRYKLYKGLADAEENVYFGGRLGEYRYYDMQDTIKSALQKVRTWLQG